MNPLTILRAALFVLLMVTMTVYADTKQDAYQPGTITKNFSAAHKSYSLKGAGGEYQINNCGDFQTGQTVDFRVEDLEIFIRREGGKDYKCSVEATVTANVEKAPLTYQKGTIMGWSTRLEIYNGGSSNTLTFGGKRRTRIYELKGASLIYQIDDCGSFQAGQFTTGQAVDYRVDETDKNDKRIYVRHDGDKEYKCRMEGVRGVEGAKPDAPSTAH